MKCQRMGYTHSDPYTDEMPTEIAISFGVTAHWCVYNQIQSVSIPQCHVVGMDKTYASGCDRVNVAKSQQCWGKHDGSIKLRDTNTIYMPMWWNGRHGGLKLRR